MALLGKAAVAMWWHIAPEHREEFLDWHTHEHQPERMGIAGFNRGSRWTSTTDATGFFVMYELADRATLTGTAYMQRLNNPSPWSVKLMPHHRQMVRSLADVTFSAGAGIARGALTVRLSPQEGRAAELRAFLWETLAKLVAQRGVSGAHLLETAAVTQAGMTEEQKIRGGDGTADWVVLVVGYDGAALAELGRTSLGADVLTRAGAMPSHQSASFDLSATLSGAE
ncbi:MAG: hypothetical protein ABI907_02410 [Ramlibacter sp.]